MVASCTTTLARSTWRAAAVTACQASADSSSADGCCNRSKLRCVAGPRVVTVAEGQAAVPPRTASCRLPVVAVRRLSVAVTSTDQRGLRSGLFHVGPVVGDWRATRQLSDSRSAASSRDPGAEGGEGDQSQDKDEDKDKDKDKHGQRRGDRDRGGAGEELAEASSDQDAVRGNGSDDANDPDNSGQGGAGNGEPDSSDVARFRDRVERMLSSEDGSFAGRDLATLIRTKYGRSYDVQLIRKQFMGKNLLAMNVMWKYREQRSFPLTKEEYLVRLDGVAEVIRELGAVSQVRDSLQKTRDRPRIGKAVSIFIDLAGAGPRADEWLM